MGFVSEFKEFAMKGNVVDMAVGIIIGAEFGKIVNSLVNDVIMPPIGLAIGGVKFTDLKVLLRSHPDDPRCRLPGRAHRRDDRQRLRRGSPALPGRRHE